MKEIKFRAWDTKKQIFVPNGDIIFSDYGDTRITVNPNCMEYIGDSCHNYNEDSRFKIMQFTGLFDKNGVEIYEGDIVKITTESNSWISKVGNHGVWHEVIVNDLDLDIDFISINYAYDVLDCKIEVIGNIYENEELLN